MYPRAKYPQIMQRLSTLISPVRRVAAAWRTVRRSAALVPDALEAVLTLPRLSGQLEIIGFQTATLNDMYAEIGRLRADTGALPRIDETLEQVATLLDRVERNTAAVEQLAEIVVPLQGAALRVGRMAERWPPSRRIRP